jgi:hypothetical protein
MPRRDALPAPPYWSRSAAVASLGLHTAAAACSFTPSSCNTSRPAPTLAPARSSSELRTVKVGGPFCGVLVSLVSFPAIVACSKLPHRCLLNSSTEKSSERRNDLRGFIFLTHYRACVSCCIKTSGHGSTAHAVTLITPGPTSLQTVACLSSSVASFVISISIAAAVHAQ